MCIFGQDFDLYFEPQSDRSEAHCRVRMYRTRSAAGVSCIHLGWEGFPPTFEGAPLPIERQCTQDPLLRRCSAARELAAEATAESVAISGAMRADARPITS
jgi:hypothetical protein